jgi:Fe-S cluster biogenesis protein NfuA
MDIQQKEKIEKKITETLDKIRPYLVADGGDVSFVELTNDLEVKVHLTGACGQCPFSLHTLKAGIEQSIIQEIPQIKGVLAI